VPPVGLTRLQGIVCRLGLRAIGLLAVRREELFPSHATLYRFDRPSTLANRVHSLVPLLPFGVPSSVLLAAPFGAAVLLGFVPLRGITDGIHERGSSQTSALFRPQVFSTSRRFSPPSVLRAYCIPLPRAGFQPFRGFSRSTVGLVRRQVVPPRRCRPSAHRQAGCHPRTPRPRGFAPWTDAFLRVGV